MLLQSAQLLRNVSVLARNHRLQTMHDDAIARRVEIKSLVDELERLIVINPRVGFDRAVVCCEDDSLTDRGVCHQVLLVWTNLFDVMSFGSDIAANKWESVFPLQSTMAFGILVSELVPG